MCWFTLFALRLCGRCQVGRGGHVHPTLVSNCLCHLNCYYLGHLSTILVELRPNLVGLQFDRSLNPSVCVSVFWAGCSSSWNAPCTSFCTRVCPQLSGSWQLNRLKKQRSLSNSPSSVRFTSHMLPQQLLSSTWGSHGTPDWGPLLPSFLPSPSWPSTRLLQPASKCRSSFKLSSFERAAFLSGSSPLVL